MPRRGVGSLTAAARELGYAQPSVSEQVRLLEQGLGAKLFRRVGRGLVPTEAAHALRPHAERSLAAVAAGRSAVASVRELDSGTVRFVQATGGALSPRAEVEDIETALEVAAGGLADCIAARGVLYVPGHP